MDRALQITQALDAVGQLEELLKQYGLVGSPAWKVSRKLREHLLASDFAVKNAMWQFKAYLDEPLPRHLKETEVDLQRMGILARPEDDGTRGMASFKTAPEDDEQAA